MIEMTTENEPLERLRLQQLGEGWIRAVMDGAPERLEQFCQPDITSSLLTPKRFVTFSNIADLVARYRMWFDGCTDYQLEAKRIGRVGERLAIFYRFLLQSEGEWLAIEQQLYCTLKEGRVEKLHLLCSGFQPVGVIPQAPARDAANAGEPDPARDELLEFRADESDDGSTCAVLTPAITAKLRKMESGQVLEVRVDDPTARGDIEAWSRLSGNALLKVVDEDGEALRFFVKKK